ERVIAADVGVRVVPGAVLGEAVRLADRRVEIDRQRRRAGSGAGRPGPGEQLAADPVELADVAPAKAAQERPQGRRRLDREAEDPGRAAGAQGVRVVDTVAPGQRREDEREELVANVRSAGLRPEIEMLGDEPPEAEVLSQG